MNAHLSRRSNLGGERLQSGFVAIGEREIAAAPAELDRQRTADAAGSPGDRGSATNCFMSML